MRSNNMVLPIRRVESLPEGVADVTICGAVQCINFASIMSTKKQSLAHS